MKNKLGLRVFDMINIHATLVKIMDKGVLLIGKSGIGKSDVALRLIMDKNALLVADDRVNIKVCNDILIGSSPDEIRGKLEVRNIGIVETEYAENTKIDLCVELVNDRSKLERMPLTKYEEILGVSIPKIELYPFDCSTIHKIIQKISGKII